MANIVRRRWPTNTIDHIAREWGLTKGQASGVLYAQASRGTLNLILKHKRGGLKLWLAIIAEVTGEKLEHYIASQAEEARRERERLEAEEAAHEANLATLIERRVLAGRSSQLDRESGRSDASLG